MPQPPLVTARDAVEFATVAGARANHLERRVGALTPGKEGDAIVRGTDAREGQDREQGTGRCITDGGPSCYAPPGSGAHMPRLCFLVVAIMAGGSAVVFTQARPYNVIMKDVATSFDALRKSVAAPDFATSAEQARRLERLFKETEDFWMKFRTRDALDAATGAQELSAAIAAAANSQDGQKLKTSADGLGRFCTACHDSHRVQMPDKSYRIRP